MAVLLVLGLLGRLVLGDVTQKKWQDLVLFVVQFMVTVRSDQLAIQVELDESFPSLIALIACLFFNWLALLSSKVACNRLEGLRCDLRFEFE